MVKEKGYAKLVKRCLHTRIIYKNVALMLQLSSSLNCNALIKKCRKMSKNSLTPYVESAKI